MTDREKLEKLLKLFAGPIRIFGLNETLNFINSVAVHPYVRAPAGPIRYPANTDFLELHLILSECACLIAEYKLNLPHFFD
jgi:hypothetical protein